MELTDKKKADIVLLIDKLREQIKCDFVGLALQEKEGPNINWPLTSGNANDKYERITVRYGKGIAGRVLSTGRPFQINYFPQDIIGKALEYPIMLAEKLLFAYAVPLLISGIPKGVLLIGSRDNFVLTEEAKQRVLSNARVIEKLIQS